jgi:hypothetical protein
MRLPVICSKCGLTHVRSYLDSCPGCGGKVEPTVHMCLLVEREEGEAGIETSPMPEGLSSGKKWKVACGDSSKKLFTFEPKQATCYNCLQHWKSISATQEQ